MDVQSRRKTMKTLKTIILALTSAFILSGCFDGGSSHGGSGTGGGSTPSKTTFTLGETFRFDDLDLTFSPDIVYTRLQNTVTDIANHKMMILPFTITNKKSEPHDLNMFYYECYGPSGVEVKNLSAYYYDDPSSSDFGGKIVSGLTATRNLYFLYDGDGSYSIRFDDYSTRITLKFNVIYVDSEQTPELDKPFSYNNLELTFSSDYSIVVYQASEYSIKRNVVKMPVTVKNIGYKANSLGMFDMQIYGPSGSSVIDMNTYYSDVDAVEYAEDLQPGSSYTKSMYFEYGGDGQYKIDFGTFSVLKSLKFNIQKS